MDNFYQLTPEEFEAAKDKFDPDWGAPKVVRRALGTYDNPEQWWRNFDKFYNRGTPENDYKDAEVVDLSNVPGFGPGDLAIPIPAEDRKNQGDPEWTVFNPDGLDFGDVNQHGDIVANILGYVGARAGMTAAGFTYGGPVGATAGILAGEAVSNTAAQAAEAGWDAMSRSGGENYAGQPLENPTAGQQLHSRAVQGAVDTGVGAITEKAGGWLGRLTNKIGTKIADYRPLQTDDTRKVAKTRAELEHPGVKDLFDPKTGGFTEKAEEKFNYRMETYRDMYSTPEGRNELILEVGKTMRFKDWTDAASFTDQLMKQSQGKLTDEQMEMLASLNAAEANLFPIELSLGSVGTVSQNRMIQLMEGFSNLLPMGHHQFEQAYNTMIADIDVGVQKLGRAWLQGKSYKAYPKDSMMNIHGDVVGHDVANAEWQDVLVEQQRGVKLDEIGRNIGDPDSPAYLGPEYEPQRLTPSELEDQYRQIQANQEVHPEIYFTEEFEDLAGKHPDFQMPTVSGRKDDIVPHAEMRRFDSPEDPFISLETGSPIASKDAIGSYARQGLELGNKKVMKDFDASIDELMANYNGRFPDDAEWPDVPFNWLDNTEELFGEIKPFRDRVRPSGDDIYNRAVNEITSNIKGLQPDWDFAENIVDRALKEVDKYEQWRADLAMSRQQTQASRTPEQQQAVDMINGIAEMAAAGMRPKAEDFPGQDLSMAQSLSQYFESKGGGTLDGSDEAFQALKEAATEAKMMLKENREGVEKGTGRAWGPQSVNDALGVMNMHVDGLRYMKDITDDFMRYVDKNPTVGDMYREYRRLNEIIGMSSSKGRDQISHDLMVNARDALRKDIYATFEANGDDRIAETFLRIDKDMNSYLDDKYYPMIRNIIESESDVRAYDLLMKHTKEGPNNLQTFMDQMPFEHQDAIRATTFMRLGKENPHSFDPKDFSMTKAVKEWKSIPDRNKDIMWQPKGHPLRDAMDSFMTQIEQLEHIEGRAGQGAVGQIVAATIVVGGIIGALAQPLGGFALTGDFNANVGGMATGSAIGVGATIASSYGIGKIFTKPAILDRMTRIIRDAGDAQKKGMLRNYFSKETPGTFQYGMNRLAATMVEEGEAQAAERVIAHMMDAMSSTAYAAGVKDMEMDWSDPENVQGMLERMSDAQGIELRHDMTPQDIKDLETIYREMGRSP